MTTGGPYDGEQRTIQVPADVADCITELLRAELENLNQGRRAADDDQGDDLTDTSEW